MTLSGSTPRDAEFLRYRTPNGGSYADCFTVGSTAENYLGSIHVGVVPMTAPDAHELRLRAPILRRHMPALGTGLRRESRWHFLDAATLGDDLVAEHLRERAPTNVENRPVQARLLVLAGFGPQWPESAAEVAGFEGR